MQLVVYWDNTNTVDMVTPQVLVLPVMAEGCSECSRLSIGYIHIAIHGRYASSPLHLPVYVCFRS